jgi:tagatose-6-phosphate ketose/aldose isomerase
VINSSTLLVYLFSNNDYSHHYEKDLVNGLNKGQKGLAQIGIFETKNPGLPLETEIILAEDQEKIDEEFLSVCCVLPSQILGFFKSLPGNIKEIARKKFGYDQDGFTN